MKGKLNRLQSAFGEHRLASSVVGSHCYIYKRWWKHSKHKFACNSGDIGFPHAPFADGEARLWRILVKA